MRTLGKLDDEQIKSITDYPDFLNEDEIIELDKKVEDFL